MLQLAEGVEECLACAQLAGREAGGEMEALAAELSSAKVWVGGGVIWGTGFRGMVGGGMGLGGMGGGGYGVWGHGEGGGMHACMRLHACSACPCLCVRICTYACQYRNPTTLDPSPLTPHLKPYNSRPLTPHPPPQTLQP